MPCRHGFLSPGVLLLCYEGRIRRAEQRDMLETVVADPRYKRDMPVLNDVSRIQSSEIDLSMILIRRERLAEHYAGLPRPVRWVYYAPSDMSFGLSRMTATVLSELSELDIAITDDRAEALDHIGMSPALETDWKMFVET
ncbi:hypothetical protein R3X27_10950 [Tropicimonas sp. TH_r6]|uniref:hypothetical protein n=1 Tax=Tropicimonas sp. TH_r6 TaxID=3082085 RepID=UPI002953CE94|nr:hypothetical protein [Tropicimonas sp. TH_r6]MDV7143198.1 hypothetical protein [Tropicimonas sp. TH_r6]